MNDTFRVINGRYRADRRARVVAREREARCEPHQHGMSIGAVATTVIHRVTFEKTCAGIQAIESVRRNSETLLVGLHLD